MDIIINGQRVEVEPGTMVLDAILETGIEVPTLCSVSDLTPTGNCRMCSVELKRNGRSWVTSSCNYPVEEGLEVVTDSPRAEATRRMMAELLLARCPNVPSVQRLAASVGVDEPRFATENPDEDCVLCGLCVQVCRDVAKKDVIGFIDRGPERKITSAFEVAYSDCDSCNKCIPYCPTGAITRLPDLQIGQKLHAEAVKGMRTRQAVQYSLLGLFLVFMAATSLKVQWPVEVVNLFSRFDPLQAITAMIAAREPILLFIPALLTIAATLVFGRVWCGWICPLGAILELFGPVGTRKVPQGMRQVKYWLLGIILLMAAAGSLAFMFLDPITILVRGIANTLDPIVRQPFSGFAQISLIGVISFLPLAAVLGLNAIEKRFWCRYLCPLGALVGLGSKFSWINRRVDKFSCVDCGDCSRACSMGAINSEDASHDPAECLMCKDCATVCPKAAIGYKKSDMPARHWNFEFDPGRREFLGSAATAAAAVGVFSFMPQAKTNADDLLRPPGVSEEEFLSKCIRCGQCVEACATHALHPAQSGTRWDGLWTPALMARHGYCDYECNRCGQICPSGAIPSLPIEEKRKQVIGVAVVDNDLCINCMVCREECAYDAIETGEIQKKNGQMKPLPIVKVEKCVGCGQCEFKCPEPPAIKVFTVNSPKVTKA